MKTKKAKIVIRWLGAEDIDQILELETTSCEHFWDKEYITKLIRTENIIGMGAFSDKQLVGYMFLYFDHEAREEQLLNVVIHPDFRRKKLGSRFVKKAKEFNRHYNVTLIVRESNKIAHLFLKANKLKAIGVAKNFFEDEWKSGEEKEDGYVFIFEQPMPV